MSIVLVVTGITRLLRVSQVPPSSSAAGAVVAMMAGSSSSGTGGTELHPRGPTLGLSYRRPPGMHLVFVVCLRRSLFFYSCSDLKKWCRGDRSRASSVSVVRWFMARQVIPPCLPLMVSSIASVGDLVKVASGSQRPMVALVPGVPSAGCATQGATGVRVVGVGPHLGHDAESSLRDLVMRGAGADNPGSAIPGDAALAPRFSSATDQDVSGLYLPDSPVFSPLSIN
jgi:hypothetical protein